MYDSYDCNYINKININKNKIKKQFNTALSCFQNYD